MYLLFQHFIIKREREKERERERERERGSVCNCLKYLVLKALNKGVSDKPLVVPDKSFYRTALTPEVSDKTGVHCIFLHSVRKNFHLLHSEISEICPDLKNAFA